MSQPQTVVRHAASSSFRRAASGLLRLAASAALSFALVACGGGGGGTPAGAASGGGGGGGTPAPTPSVPASSVPVATYQISGTLTGLSAGASVGLLVNGQALTVSQNGGFTTTASLPTGTAYSVTVGTQPTDETCVVSNGSGVIGTSNVINVTVACTVNPQATYTIGGTASGLSGTLQLLDNSNDTVTVSSNGAFTFPQALFDQASYSVTLGTTQPAGQTCTIANGSGTVQGANVTSVQVSCVDNPPPPPPPPPASTYTLGGTVSGLTGTVVLSQGTQSVSVSVNGTYAFPTALASGASSAVTVATQPTGQTCSVANGTGTVGSSNVTNVNVTCATNTSSYSIGGSLAGLTPGAGISVVLQDNAGDDLTLANNGTFTFATQIATGATYNVTVKTQPTGQTCSVTSGSGTVASSNVTNVAVNCATGSTTSGQVSTFAGSGLGATDGTGTVARFLWPQGVATDASGNVYVADALNNRIRKITPAGLVTTLAGSGAKDSADGTGSAASFNDPTGVATDASGNVYVADSGNMKIRKITPVGVVTTLAGSGFYGSDDGVGAAASFYTPSGVATDTQGNVYVADTYNHEIRKITPAGMVTTLAGLAGIGGSAPVDGTGSAARFWFPMGVATDTAGNVYVADTGHNMIRKITPVGVVTTLAGSVFTGSTDGTGSAARFRDPQGVATDASGNVYVADTYNYEIRKIAPAGVVTTLAGSGTRGSADGVGSAASFDLPMGVATDASGNVYVADTSNNTIRKITP